jgi:hypothetical protein
VKKAWIAAGGLALACVWGCGLVDDEQTATWITIAAGIAVAGGAMGGLIGAGHTRERRAWTDYQELRAKVPVARRAWMAALGESLRRMMLPVAALAAALAWWKWGR